jgi:hypothetical protein
MIPAGYVLSDKAKAAGYTDAAQFGDPATMVSQGIFVATPTSSLTTGNEKLLGEQKTNLKSTLDTAKDKELTRLDDILASRGVSRGGGVGAGTAEIAKNYADALATGNVGLDTNMATLNLQQKNQDMMSKYYEALMKNMTGGKSGGTIINLPTTDPFAPKGSTLYNPDGKTLNYGDKETGGTTTSAKRSVQKSPVYNIY